MTNKIFVDTNMFFYFLFKQEPYWKILADLLDDKTKELSTSVLVLNELKYKLLWTEAMNILNNNHKHEILKKIKGDKLLRGRVYGKYLPFYLQLKARFSILDYTDDDELSTCSLTLQYGLLPSDAAIVAGMLRNNIQHILTNDEDFKTVDNITVINPNKN